MIFKALKMGFVENKGQSGPLPVVSTTKGSGANVSCQLNFRLFVSCQLTPSRPSNNSPFKQSYFSLSIIRALPYSNVQIMRVLLLKSVCGTRNNCRSILRCQWNTRGTKALLKVFKHKKKSYPRECHYILQRYIGLSVWWSQYYVYRRIYYGRYWLSNHVR